MAASRLGTPTAILQALQRLKTRFGPPFAKEKIDGLRALERVWLPQARQVERLHELLCFWRAYPDDRRVAATVERLLSAFARRRDLRHHADALENTGIAGTSMRFPFFAPTARWLARRWPGQLTVDWDRFENTQRLASLLPLVVHGAEIPALDEIDRTPRQWIRRMKGPRESEAAFLVRRLANLPMNDAAREILYDDLDPPLVLRPGATTPSRTLARHRRPPGAPPSYARGEGTHARPSPSEIGRLRPMRVRLLTPAEGRRAIDLARGAMVARERDLDVFSYGSPYDVREVEFDGGLSFLCIGALPERRLLLEAVYGFVTLKNGVPVGYVLVSALFGSSEIAYNVFDTYRGAEAGWIYARVLAMTRHLFGSDTFTIFPYQLGEGNEEAVASGAWWFYQKMGFRPRDAAVTRLMLRELARMKSSPRHRTGPATLKRMAKENLYLRLGRERDDVIGRLELPNVGEHVMKSIAARFGSDREAAEHVCAREAAVRLGVRPSSWSPAERAAWRRWAPVILILPGLGRWSPAERRGLAEVVRAKGGRRESEFVRRFDAHRQLRAAMRALTLARPG